MGIEHSSIVDARLADVFAWHTRPGALQRLSPPWLPGRVRREAGSLADGRAELALPGGIVWAAQHDPSGFEPDRAFVDERVDAGLGSIPLAPLRWRHEHRFEPRGEDRTLVHDRVETIVGSRALRPMFVYRHRQLADDLAAHRSAAAEPMTVAVTGASGLIGTALTALLTTGGHDVVRLVRHEASSSGERRWDPDAPAADLLEGVDAVVHLAGASIFGRLGEQHRRAVRDSRIGPTRKLAEIAAASGARAFVSASGIGRYGVDRGSEQLTEAAGPGDDFVARVVVDWEADAAVAAEGRMRAVQVRTGLVQSPRGGVLQVLAPLYAAGLGGPLAGGEHWQSWIDLDDLLDVYLRALTDERLSGPVNAVAPHPVQQHEYAETLARVLRRPALVPTPALGPRVLLGRRGAEELALADQRVVPARLTELGHRFRRPRLEDSLRHQLGRMREAGR
ncbi:TIGR01777 family oxidoreductase [Agrococcus sp. Marseille-Q4369]|uniref:TIGR01777 family oxidoreductase n=1 Tax=Agrococcus sp. Marseille-Q4369 TaxID=2810513 RepID=UPI001B8CB124|nr:TIGR01777 family oxidoreductase [Agrococcus sp. Marseille-Q4369]QUW18302.1 TIGR01777 family oxidoreductase [Agrococcus sp. Marseille-Q4369]